MIVQRPQYIDVKISDGQSVFDIVREVKKAIQNSYKQAKEVNKVLEKTYPNDYDYLLNVWKLAKTKITYKKEPIEIQTAKEFSRIWHDGFGDCKHFTIFITSILYNNKKFRDKIRLRIINHNGKNYSHIYPIIVLDKGYLVLDGTASTFNKEGKYIKKLDFKI